MTYISVAHCDAGANDGGVHLITHIPHIKILSYKQVFRFEMDSSIFEFTFEYPVF